MKLFKSLAVATALAVTASAANAATCSVGKVDYSLTQGTPDSVTDSACFSGNDKGAQGIASKEVFSVSGWTLGYATDDADGTGMATISLVGQSWSVGGTLFENMMVALKQSTTYALFKLDTTKALSGTWGTFTAGSEETTKNNGKPKKDNGKSVTPGSLNDLSHASIWYSGSRIVAPPVVEPSPVPLPAGGALLLSALAGFGILRRRKSA